MVTRPRVAPGSSSSPATADTAIVLLRGGGLPALVTGTVLTAGVAVAGTEAVTGAALGTVVASAAMSAGPLVMRATRRWSPPAVMAVALATYGGVVTILGGVYLVLARAAWMSSGHLAAALVVCGAVWVAGQLRAASRLRVLVFGDGQPPGDTSPPR